jgi:hypothetical protein
MWTIICRLEANIPILIIAPKSGEGEVFSEHIQENAIDHIVIRKQQSAAEHDDNWHCPDIGHVNICLVTTVCLTWVIFTGRMVTECSCASDPKFLMNGSAPKCLNSLRGPLTSFDSADLNLIRWKFFTKN